MWGVDPWGTAPWGTVGSGFTGGYEDALTEVGHAHAALLYSEIINNVLEIAHAHAFIISGQSFKVSAFAVGHAADKAIVAWFNAATDTGHAHANVVTFYKSVSEVIDTAIAHGVVDTVLGAKNALVVVATARDLAVMAASGGDGNVTETGHAHAALIQNLLEFNAQMIEEAVAHAALAEFQLSLVMAVTDIAHAHATLAISNLAMHELIRDGAKAVVTFALNGDVYTGVVLHPENAGAVTEYRQFPFNSFAYFNGTYYGVNNTGVYALTGDDDAGVPIHAHIRTGLLRIADGLLARMPVAYFGIAMNGDMLLKVITTSKLGAKQENWYKLERRTAGTMRETRVKPAQGLKSVYWGFELTNVDGAFFNNDAIQFYPVALERRVR